eukprot:6201890-Pleurochrysis_carterae.AAC.1
MDCAQRGRVGVGCSGIGARRGHGAQGWSRVGLEVLENGVCRGDGMKRAGNLRAVTDNWGI